jgi:hypothetical protein
MALLYTRAKVIRRIERLVKSCPFKAKYINVSTDMTYLLEEIRLCDNPRFEIKIEDGIYKAFYKNIPIVKRKGKSQIYLTNF